MYNIRLDSLECSKDGCEMISEFCTVYVTANGESDIFSHQFWCSEHDSIVYEGEK